MAPESQRMISSRFIICTFLIGVVFVLHGCESGGGCETWQWNSEGSCMDLHGNGSCDKKGAEAFASISKDCLQAINPPNVESCLDTWKLIHDCELKTEDEARCSPVEEEIWQQKDANERDVWNKVLDAKLTLQAEFKDCLASDFKGISQKHCRRDSMTEAEKKKYEECHRSVILDVTNAPQHQYTVCPYKWWIGEMMNTTSCDQWD
jgi:hypothetical protein